MKLDHEKLDVYQLELEFVAWATELLDEVQRAKEPRASSVCDHFDRASLSVLFNTAEGNGKRRRNTRGKFFDDARGSATECAACLDALVAKGICTRERVRDGKKMLLRIVSMLSRLVQLFSSADGVREDIEDYRTDDEDEDEGEKDGEDEPVTDMCGSER